MEYLKQKKTFLTNAQRTSSPEDLERIRSLREKIERNQRQQDKSSDPSLFQTALDSFDEYETFDWKRYLNSYTDLKESNLKTKKDAWYHWKKHGKMEGRIYYKINEKEGISTPQSEYADFDWEQYIDFYSDLKEHNTKDKAYTHWTNHGKSENRKFFKLSDRKEDKKEETQRIKLEILEDLYESEDEEHLKDKKETYTAREKEMEKNILEIEKEKEKEKKVQKETKRKEKFLFQEAIPKWEENFDDTEDLNEIVQDIKEQSIESTTNTSKKLDNYSELIKNYDPEAVSYENFDWRSYVQNYKDLSSLDSKKKAWEHWQSSGKKEKRVTYNLDIKEAISFIDLKLKAAQNPLKNREDIDLKFKQIYDNYGNHYFGWKKIINQFISSFLKLYENKPFYMAKKTLFDEWIEKLLLWGNKIQREQIVEEIEQKDYNIITFIHNPPYDRYFDPNYKLSVKSSVILTDEEMLNKNLFRKIHLQKLHTRITYICALSNTHKEYISKNFPFFKTKLISMYHPIEIQTAPHLLFDMDRFLDKRNIVHVGWWLRNFTTFTTFEVHPSFHKMIIVKNDFHESWISFSKNLNLTNIDIYEEMDADQYENIMRSSCIFIDLEDCVANNTVLECIKFNTPLITRRSPHLEEYLGFEYPLFFDTNEDLVPLLDENEMLARIEQAHLYLRNMDKSHVSLETFNKKLLYEIEKLERKEEMQKLTWCCFLDHTVTMEALEKILLTFNNQTDNERLELRFFTSEDVYTEIICKDAQLNRFLRLIIKKTNSSLTMIPMDENICFMDQVLENVQTDYIMFINGNDEYHNDYSIKTLRFFDKYPTCDIALCSFTDDTTTNQNIMKTGEMFFMSNIQTKTVYKGALAFRKKLLYNLELREIDILNKTDDFIYKCLINHFNVFCCSENPDLIHKT